MLKERVSMVKSADVDKPEVFRMSCRSGCRIKGLFGVARLVGKDLWATRREKPYLNCACKFLFIQHSKYPNGE